MKIQLEEAWELRFCNYAGMEKKAVHFISGEISPNFSYVLPCRSITEKIDSHCIVIGKYGECPLAQKYIDADRLSDQGYAVKVMENPMLSGKKLVLITAMEERELYYGAADFIDDYLADAAPVHNDLPVRRTLFHEPMPDYEHYSAPKISKRSVFTWGHPIKDYRSYMKNMARLRLNQLIVWNDYAPINMKEIVDYAHSYGIEVIFGFSWGWGADLDISDPKEMEKWTQIVLKTYEEQYHHLGGDGIYFQCFTETLEDTQNGVLIAKTVTDWVNRISGLLFQKYPNLVIQFGLHATSVKNHMEFLADVDPRMDIFWEDCGDFPYHYRPQNIENYEDTERFTGEILALRKKASVGLVFKGQMTMDWTCFIPQRGPFVMGEDCGETMTKQFQYNEDSWRILQSYWFANGKYAQRTIRQAAENANGSLTICQAGQFSGGIWFSEALCAQLMWDYDVDYEQTASRVARRKCIRMV